MTNLHAQTRFERARAQAQVALSTLREGQHEDHYFALEAHADLLGQADAALQKQDLKEATRLALLARDLMQEIYIEGETTVRDSYEASTAPAKAS